MPRAPDFWWSDGPLARLLSPLSAVTAALTARRTREPGWRAPVPVICCGNVTVGGAGKTTLVLDIAQRLRRRGVGAHILLRGYGGRVRGVHSVQPEDTAALVGDEALLLSAVAPTWTSPDRSASARLAIAAGAQVLVMDDGLQNPTLEKTVSLLTIDGRAGFGNGRILPAGPLREPVAAAAARAQAAILIGADQTGALAALPAHLPVLRARLVQDAAIAGLAGRRVLAFAGIASPEKFFAPLREAGAVLTASRGFADHHMFSRRELAALVAQAAANDAVLVTTPKDAVRLPPEVRPLVTVIGVGLAWDDPLCIERLLESVIDR